MTTHLQYTDFRYKDAAGSHMFRHLVPHVLALVAPLKPGVRVPDIGCGDGAICREMLRRGCDVVGIDLSEEGIGVARKMQLQGRFELMEADERVLERLNEHPFDLVISTELIEHVYAPRA